MARITFRQKLARNAVLFLASAVLFLSLGACGRAVLVLAPADSLVTAEPVASTEPPTPASTATLQPTAAAMATETPAAVTVSDVEAFQQGQAAALTPEGGSGIDLESVCSPLEGHHRSELYEIVSAPYAPPPPGREERHHGVDFSYYARGERASIQGVGVQAVLPGSTAAALAESFPYGNVIIVETPGDALAEDLRSALGLGEGEGLYTLYAHLDAPPGLAQGDAVTTCELLGQVGKSGNAGVAHLHMETRVGPSGAVFPVLGFYLADHSEEEREAYLRWRTSGLFRHFDPMTLLAE